MVDVVFSFGSHSASSFLSFFRYGSSDLTITSQSTSHFTLTGAGYTFTINGSFIPGSPMSSSVTYMEASYGGETLIRISDFDLPFFDAMGFTSYSGLIAEIDGQMEGDDRFISDLSINHVFLSLGGNDWIETGSGNDWIDTGLGNDTARTGSGDDRVSGSGGSDHIFGGSGDDTLSGGVGRDILIGGSGRDLLVGERGNDVLNGGALKDVLVANTGNDRLIGGKGGDTFVFRHRDGRNIISDFGNGNDQIEIQHGARSMAQLDFTQSGDDVIVSFAHTTLIVRDWQVDDLQNEDHFLFT